MHWGRSRFYRETRFRMFLRTRCDGWLIVILTLWQICESPVPGTLYLCFPVERADHSGLTPRTPPCCERLDFRDWSGFNKLLWTQSPDLQWELMNHVKELIFQSGLSLSSWLRGFLLMIHQPKWNWSFGFGQCAGCWTYCYFSCQ